MRSNTNTTLPAVALRALVAGAALFLLTALPTLAQTGSLEGQVVREDGSGVGGVAVIVSNVGLAEITDNDGTYRFGSVPAGTYVLTFTLGERVDTEDGVEIVAGETTTLTNTVDWQINFAETLVVTSASRRAERIVDAPAAVSVVTESEIEANAAGGQIPKLLEFTPGVELTQGGLYDFNINSRGFNSSLNRRVAYLVDGRDPSVPFLASQDWGAASQPFADIQSLEMVRGPAAALYGANSSSGVINVTTKNPRSSQGGSARLTGGELSTLNADLRYAFELGGGWYGKALGSWRSSETFDVNRVGQAEYTVPCGGGVSENCLPQESVAFGDLEVEGWTGNLRFDKYFADESQLLTMEGGDSSVDGVVVQTNIGRVLVSEINRPWLRLNYNTPRWNFLAFQSTRDAPDQTNLVTGRNLALDSERTGLEVQTNWDLGQNARIVGGVSYRKEDVDSFDPLIGGQSLMFRSQEDEQAAAFGQVDFDLGDRFTVVLAARYDESDLFYDEQFSPKAALVYSINANNSLRFTYNEGFQAANYSEKFLEADVAAPLDLSAIEQGFCAPFGVDCGFDNVRILAVGNPDLGVEEVKAFEIGYSGIFGGKAFLTVDYYNTENTQFVTDLISTQGTPLGDFNTAFGPYQAPAALPGPVAAALQATLQGALGPTYFALSNNFDGSPIVAAVSYSSFGDVDTQGVDVGLNFYVNPFWTVQANYSWFDFEIQEDVPGLTDLLAPNSPENSVRASVDYNGDRYSFGFSGRWVEEFFWATGPFVGTVPSYETFDLNAGYRLNDSVRFGLSVSNVFDDEHYEAFGGNLIGRRALGSVSFDF